MNPFAFFQPHKFYCYRYFDAEKKQNMMSVNWRCYAVAYHHAGSFSEPTEIPLFQRHGAGPLIIPEHDVVHGKVVFKHKWEAQ